MNDKLKQLQDFLKAKQVIMSVDDINQAVNFLDQLKTPEPVTGTPTPKKK